MKKYNLGKHVFNGFECEVYTIKQEQMESSFKASYGADMGSMTSYKGYTVQTEKQARDIILNLFK